MSAAPELHNGSTWVPWHLYLSDRERDDRRWARVDMKLDELLEAHAHDDGREVAEEAAASAVQSSRRSRGEILRDVSLCIFSAALAVVGALISANLTGG